MSGGARVTGRLPWIFALVLPEARIHWRCRFGASSTRTVWQADVVHRPLCRMVFRCATPLSGIASMTNPIATVYRGYLRCFSLFGNLCSGPYHGICELLSTLKTAVGSSEVTISSAATFAEIQRSAHRAGAGYRGGGGAGGV